MARPRLELHAILVDLLGSNNVYFQQPSGVLMQYPAIVYSRDYNYTEHANNAIYVHRNRYLITGIDRDPDSFIFDKIEALPLTSFVRRYPADGLNHAVFNTFF